MDVILGKTSGFCYGVKRAVEGSMKQLENDKKAYCLGELVHNKQVISKLMENGMIFIDDLEQAKDKNLKVIVRAHGISKEVYEASKNKKIELVDFTCPSVLKIHDIVEEYRDNGFYIILTCSKKTHPEVIGIDSFCGKNYSLVGDTKELEIALQNFKKSDLSKLLLISQTTYSTKKFDEIERKLKEKITQNVELVIKNTICLATQIRQNETEKIAREVEKMIIIGGKNSSNTQKLYEIALKNCKDTICIQTKDDIANVSFDGINKVGIMAGASTPYEIIDEIVSTVKNINQKHILQTL